eukprot:508090_1
MVLKRKKFRTKKSKTKIERILRRSLIRQLSLTPIKRIEEVNMFKSNGTVVHFNFPCVRADTASHIFAVTGNYTYKKTDDLNNNDDNNNNDYQSNKISMSIHNNVSDDLHNGNNFSDLSGIQQLVTTLSEEREWMITMLQGRDNYDGFIRWRNKLLTKYRPNIQRLETFQVHLNRISRLKYINEQLNKERNLLFKLCQTYLPNASKIWNGLFTMSQERLQANDISDEERVRIITKMMSQKNSEAYEFKNEQIQLQITDPLSTQKNISELDIKQQKCNNNDCKTTRERLWKKRKTKFKKCSKCKDICYCSRKCQKIHW